jgi:hypothetical protein
MTTTLMRKPIKPWSLITRRTLRLSAERAEHDPWQHEYRRVVAAVERTGDESLFVDYALRFHGHLALLYPPTAVGPKH